MTSGIYAITNITDGKKYIGRAVNTDKRWEYHQWMLENNRHFNPHLQRAWNRGDEFKFSIIEECKKELLNDKEIYWIAHFKTMDMRYGYNLCAGGQATTGRVCSVETKRKISQAHKGRKWSAEAIAKRTATVKRKLEEDPEYLRRRQEQGRANAKKRGDPWNKGKRTPLETRLKQSASGKGKKKPKSQGEKLRQLYSGEKSLSAKLKELDVVQIRLRFLHGERQIDIHKDYPQITTQTMYDIVRNRRWKCVPNTIEELEEKYGDKVLQNQ